MHYSSLQSLKQKHEKKNPITSSSTLVSNCYDVNDPITIEIDNSIALYAAGDMRPL